MTAKKLNITDDVFETFKPRDYLNYYYNRIDDENRNLLEFFAESYKGMPANSTMLEFGGGPTIYQIITAAAHVKKIDFCDYLEANLDEVRLWKANSPEAFSWDAFVRRALEIEGLAVTEQVVKEREDLIRSKLGTLMPANAFLANPCGETYKEKYDVLGLIFVPEGITDSQAIWESSLANITSLLKPGGKLVTAAILGADYWHSGPQELPAVNLKEDDFKETLPTLGLRIDSIKTIASEAPDPNDPSFTGYTGMVFIQAQKT